MEDTPRCIYMTLADNDPDDDDDDDSDEDGDGDGDDDDDDDSDEDDGIASFLSPTRNPKTYRCCPPEVNICEGRHEQDASSLKTQKKKKKSESVIADVVSKIFKLFK